MSPALSSPSSLFQSFNQISLQPEPAVQAEANEVDHQHASESATALLSSAMINRSSPILSRLAEGRENNSTAQDSTQDSIQFKRPLPGIAKLEALSEQVQKARAPSEASERQQAGIRVKGLLRRRVTS